MKTNKKKSEGKKMKIVINNMYDLQKFRLEIEKWNSGDTSTYTEEYQNEMKENIQQAQSFVIEKLEALKSEIVTLKEKERKLQNRILNTQKDMETLELYKLLLNKKF
mgnify:CR=1 FL=1